MNVLDEFKNYKRKFIQISPRTAILLHIFSKDSDDFEDIVLLDNEGYREKSYCTKIYKDAADQFFKQFEGNECLCFVKYLRDKCNKMLKEHEDKVQKQNQIKIMKNISENTIKLFKSNYKLAISELENKILEKEMELDNFFNNDNISKSKNSYTVSLFYTYYDKNLFKRYHELKQDITKYYNLLQEYKTTYDNFILGLENESNSNQ